jgi:sulfatase maturation enzyme AslB (radical SAM superfamily)
MSIKFDVNHADSVLFLGNNDQSTDLEVTRLAHTHNTHNHGLISDAEFVPKQPGFWHTSVADISWGGMLQLAARFDSIIMLDQPQNEWSHWKCMLATCRIMLSLETSGKHTVFRDNNNTKKVLYWIDLVYKKNKSFCIYPWINLNNEGTQTKLCARDKGTVTQIDKILDWSKDPAYNKVRQAMINGESLPEHCQVCYDYENKGMESYRQFETVDWVTQLQLADTDDLAGITRPHFYEVSTGNHCNIKCRGCTPVYSKPIQIEAKKFRISPPIPFASASKVYSLDLIDIDTLDSNSSVYFQGGEPTIMPEVSKFMQQCIEKKRTDFFLTMCTNGVKITRRFLDLVAYFSNVNFSFSMDGFDRVNDYWRWGSQWQQVVDNAHRVHSLGHNVSINTVPGIYNVTNLHLLFEFLDREFPFTAVYMQVNHLPWQSAYNHPIKDLVIESMLKCQQTSIYHSNGKSCKTSIDSILSHYNNDPVCDFEHLKNFFDYNDQLDRARGSTLADYIPELELARTYLH